MSIPFRTGLDGECPTHVSRYKDQQEMAKGLSSSGTPIQIDVALIRARNILYIYSAPML